MCVKKWLIVHSSVLSDIKNYFDIVQHKQESLIQKSPSNPSDLREAEYVLQNIKSRSTLYVYHYATTHFILSTSSSFKIKYY